MTAILVLLVNFVDSFTLPLAFSVMVLIENYFKVGEKLKKANCGQLLIIIIIYLF